MKCIKKWISLLCLALALVSLLVGNIFPASVVKAAEIQTYASSEDDDDEDYDDEEDDDDDDEDYDEDEDDEDDDEDDDDEDDEDEDEDDEDDDDDDDTPTQPKVINNVRVASVNYNTNCGTKPSYNAYIADGNATVAFEGWVGTDDTASYSNYSGYGDEDKVFDTFVREVTYNYVIRIAAKKGYILAKDVSVQLNNEVFHGVVNPTGQFVTIRNSYSAESKCVHDYVVQIKKPTCTEQGETVKKCRFCGLSYTYDFVEPLGHAWKTTIDAATDEDDGSITTKCSQCKQKTVTRIAKIKSVSLTTKKYTYNGTERKPGVKAVDSDGKVIPATYYTVEYSDNKNAGDATAEITFKGNYEAELEEEFEIVEASQSISTKVSSKNYKKTTVAKKAQSFSIGASAKTKLSYKSSSKNVTVTSAGKVTVKKGTGKGTYKITVKAASSDNYKSASKTVTVKVI